LKPFVWQARVYWEDTDAGGIVYYANYLRFLERSRTEWLRDRGVSQLALARDPGVVFSVVAIEARYRLPAPADLLSISCEPAADGGASILFSQRIWREPLAAEPLLTASVRVACLDAATLKPRRLPQVIARELPA
jgi:acyl-CoA thioester hydrolase